MTHTTTLTRDSGRRAAGTRGAPPGILTTARWRLLHGALTATVVGAAVLAAVQLGAAGPAVSPVQPGQPQAAAGAPGTATTDGGVPPNRRHGFDGRGRGGGGDR